MIELSTRITEQRGLNTSSQGEKYSYPYLEKSFVSELTRVVAIEYRVNHSINPIAKFCLDAFEAVDITLPTPNTQSSRMPQFNEVKEAQR